MLDRSFLENFDKVGLPFSFLERLLKIPSLVSKNVVSFSC